jgi:hypothetical protein
MASMDALAAELACDFVRLEQKYDLVVLQGQLTGDRPLFAPGEDVGEVVVGRQWPETSTLIIGLIGVISFAFSIGWDSYHGQGREEEEHGTATGRQQAGSCEILQTEPKKQDRRGHVSGA